MNYTCPDGHGGMAESAVRQMASDEAGQHLAGAIWRLECPRCHWIAYLDAAGIPMWPRGLWRKRITDPTWKAPKSEMSESAQLEMERRKRFVGQARSGDLAKEHRRQWDEARVKAMAASRAAAEFNERDDAGTLC